jgi:hypothetical protein
VPLYVFSPVVTEQLEFAVVAVPPELVPFPVVFTTEYM